MQWYVVLSPFCGLRMYMLSASRLSFASCQVACAGALATSMRVVWFMAALLLLSYLTSRTFLGAYCMVSPFVAKCLAASRDLLTDLFYAVAGQGEHECCHHPHGPGVRLVT